MDNNSSADSDSILVLRPESVLLYGVAESTSALFLLFSILVHLFVPNLNCRAYSLMCHTVSLLIMFLTYPLRKFIEYDIIGNVTIFVFHYTFGLAAFFWMNVLGFELWRLFADLPTTLPNERQRNSWSRRRKILLKSAYAWGIPVLMCLLNVILGFNKEFQERVKVTLSFSTANWFANERSAMPFFYVPVSILVVVNVIFFVLTVINVRKASEGAEILHVNAKRKMLRLCIKLFLVMGMCWLIEIITFIPKVILQEKLDESLYYIPDTINCFQGVYIFMVYVFKKKTVRMIRHRLRGDRAQSSISLTATRTSSLASNSTVTAPETIISSIGTQAITAQDSHSQTNSHL